MDPKTGVVIEPAHDLKDKERRQKILIFPGGKGTRSCRPTGCSSST
jgi:predicted aconitase with swiveling domain